MRHRLTESFGGFLHRLIGNKRSLARDAIIREGSETLALSEARVIAASDRLKKARVTLGNSMRACDVIEVELADAKTRLNAYYGD